MCAELEVPFLAVFPALVAATTWMREVAAGDGSHPGEAGYAALARLVDSWPSWRAWIA